MNGLTLYALADEYRELLALAADEEADEESFAAALAALGGEFEGKAVAVAQVARNLEAFRAQVMDAIQAMAQRADRAKRRAEAARAYLKEQMERAGIAKIESPWFDLAIRKNPPRLIVAEDALIPREYLRVVPESLTPDKAAIARALKAGEEVDGCRLESTTRLDIK